MVGLYTYVPWKIDIWVAINTNHFHEHQYKINLPPIISSPPSAHDIMCLVTSKPTRTYRGSVLDPPAHRSSFSAHPPAGVVRLPRGSTHSYRHSSEYRTSQPRVIEYVEEPRRRSRSVARERDYEVRGSRGSFVEGRRSVSRVRY
ncbi:hypothetical protein P280DRAFT_469739 [Massarina eburnea CBS 473.64]|uniref:Uncharacterized protein n=1 Tax=Massarina eburnea CBS 473.64 TaxID=1395130 RepID=A0A6A6RXE4_9PLEO|nr:hypothetical protein P280DRAFT_469739 [Massarina eburnea CBS 473.64]